MLHHIKTLGGRETTFWNYSVNVERTLFDLAADPGERTNLAAIRPEKDAELSGHLYALLHDQLVYYHERAWQLGWYPPKLP